MGFRTDGASRCRRNGTRRGSDPSLWAHELLPRRHRDPLLPGDPRKPVGAVLSSIPPRVADPKQRRRRDALAFRGPAQSRDADSLERLARPYVGLDAFHRCDRPRFNHDRDHAAQAVGGLRATHIPDPASGT